MQINKLVFLGLLIIISIPLRAQKQLLILSWKDRNIVSLNLEDVRISPIKLVEDIRYSYDLVSDGKDFYWSDAYRKAIGKSDIENNRFSTPYISDLENPMDIEIDTINRKIYWVDSKQKSIFRRNLDGSDNKLVLTDSLPVALAISPTENLIFWIDFASRTIKSSQLAQITPRKLNLSNLQYPIRIITDPSEKKIYISDDGANKIYRANYDGSHQEVFYQGTEKEHPFGMYIDQEEKKIYWTDYGIDKIKVASLDGSNIEDLVDITDPIGLTMLQSFNLRDFSFPNSNKASGNIELYPNPTAQYVNFFSKEKSKFPRELFIYDMKGLLLYKGIIETNPYRLDTKDFVNGIYFYQIYEGDSLFQGKFTIAK